MFTASCLIAPPLHNGGANGSSAVPTHSRVEQGDRYSLVSGESRQAAFPIGSPAYAPQSGS
jgi:hypothetical protein